MRALLASPLGFLIGLSLGALGGGGSILAVPALVYAAGQGPKAATSTSLLLVGITALVGMVTHLRAGRVRVSLGVAFGLTGVGGSIAGTALNHRLDADVLLLAFSGVVIVAAWRMSAGHIRTPAPAAAAGVVPALAGASGASAPADRVTSAGFGRFVSGLDPTQVVLVLVTGTGVGFLTGLFGVGGGFVIVPALVLVLRLPMPEAVGTSLLIIAINSSVALATRLATTSIDFGVALPFLVAAIIGVVAGGRLSGRLDPHRSRVWFAGLLVAVAIYVAIRASLAIW